MRRLSTFISFRHTTSITEVLTLRMSSRGLGLQYTTSLLNAYHKALQELCHPSFSPSLLSAGSRFLHDWLLHGYVIRRADFQTGGRETAPHLIATCDQLGSHAPLELLNPLLLPLPFLARRAHHHHRLASHPTATAHVCKCSVSSIPWLILPDLPAHH